jgi:predicted DNA-binding ribbon-helix-helix protein
MKSTVIKRSVIIDSHKTSVSVEDAFWESLRKIAEGRNQTLSHLISSINKDRQFANLSSAIRLFVLQHYRDQFHQLPKHEVATPFGGSEPFDHLEAETKTDGRPRLNLTIQ